MNLIVVRAGDGRQRSIHLPLQPNRAFGYCLPPATYEIDGVLFSDSRNNVDRAVMVEPLRFSVSPGFANYLGTLTLGRASVEHPWQVVLPQQVHSAVYSAA